MSNVLELLSGARLSNEIGHRLRQWGVPQAWASNIGTALAPTVLPHHLTSYYAARERGMDPTDARQFATSDALRTAAAAAAVYGGVEAAGAYGAGGAGSSGSVSGLPEAQAQWTAGTTGTSAADMTGSNAGGSFLSNINYQKLLGNALKSQSQSQGGQPVQSGVQMQPITSAPATVGSMNTTASQGINPALLSLLLGQR